MTPTDAPIDDTPRHVNDRRPNFYGDDGRFYLVRCYACRPEGGTENWAIAVAAGECAWCGWRPEAVAS